MPLSIENAEANVKEDPSDVSWVFEINLWGIAAGNRLSGVFPVGLKGRRSTNREKITEQNDKLLVEVGPDVAGEDHEEEDSPASESTVTTTEFLEIEKQTNENGSDNLGRPVEHAVQATGPDIEESAVEAVEFCEWGVS